MYPISFAADYEAEGRNRLTTFFRHLLAIPWAIVGGIFVLGAEVLAFLAWFAIVFTGRYPEELYSFNAKALRMIARVNGFSLLLTDEYPPFNGDPDDAYPIRVGISEPLPEYDRAKTAFRLIVGIPVLFLSWVQGIIAGVCSFVAWLVILFSGRLPDGLYGAIRSALAYQTRAAAYLLLMTEDYPPFSYDEQQEQEQGALPSTKAPPLAAPPQPTPQAGQAPPPPPPPSDPNPPR